MGDTQNSPAKRTSHGTANEEIPLVSNIFLPSPLKNNQTHVQTLKRHMKGVVSAQSMARDLGHDKHIRMYKKKLSTYIYIYVYMYMYMGVSWNGGTPKWMV